MRSAPPDLPSAGAGSPGSLRLLPLLAFLFVAATVVLRVVGSGPQAYGMGAEYIEHDVRLRVLSDFSSGLGGGPFGFLVAEDREYPPLLHVAAIPWGAVFGHSYDAASCMGLLWVALLGWAVSSCATSWTGSRRTGNAAAAVAMLLPAIPAVATRYYYDLPAASMLWAALALQVGLAVRRPAFGVPLSALAWTAAALFKWTVLPLECVAILAACRDRRSTLAAFASGLLAAFLLVQFVTTSHGGSFPAMAGGLLPAGDIAEPGGGWLASLLPDRVAMALTRPLRQVTELWGAAFLLWYPLALVVGVLSPAAALFALPLGVLGLAKARTLRVPVTAMLGFGLLIPALWVHVQDERLLLAPTPALACAAAAGWAAIGQRRLRLATGTAALAVLAAVSLDFHFCGRAPWNPPSDLLWSDYRNVRVVARGVGLASSEGGIGWLRRDEQADPRLAYREAVWEAIQEVDGPIVGIVPKRPVFGREGDGPWLRYRARAAILEGGRRWVVAEDRVGEPAPDVLVVRPDDTTWHSLDSWPDRWWERVMRVPDPAGGPEVELWRAALAPRGSAAARARTPGDVGGAEEQPFPDRPPLPVTTPRIPAACSERPPGLNVIIVEDLGRPPACSSLRPIMCLQDYLAFLLRPAVRAHARPVPDCEGLVRELFAAQASRKEPWPAGLPEPGVPVDRAILDAFGLGFLFQEPDLWRRPLEVHVVARSARQDSLGRPYLEQRLLLRDPYAGEIEALLLLPTTGTPPFSGLLALPGHVEDAACHRDHRLGAELAGEGFAVLIPTFRAYCQPEDDQATRAFLCQGFSLMGLRAYEALLGFKVLLALPEVCNSRLGLIGHSGGSMVGNLLAWLPQDPSLVHVTDTSSMYLNVDVDRMELDCETHEGLHRISFAVADLEAAPRPVLRVPYAYARCESCEEPKQGDPTPLRWMLPFLREHLGDPPASGPAGAGLPDPPAGPPLPAGRSAGP